MALRPISSKARRCTWAPTLGGLGGSVNFSTLQPTLSWISQMQMSTGSYGRYNYSVAETGSVGKLGTRGPDRRSPLPKPRRRRSLRGRQRPRLRPRRRQHDLRKRLLGALRVRRQRLADRPVHELDPEHEHRLPAIQRRSRRRRLPCGYGPNNTDSSNVQLYSLTDNALIGATQLQTSVFSLDSSGLLNELARYVNGVPSPTGLLERHAIDADTS